MSTNSMTIIVSCCGKAETSQALLQIANNLAVLRFTQDDDGFVMLVLICKHLGFCNILFTNQLIS